MTWVKLVSLGQVPRRERLQEPPTTTNTRCRACVQGTPCSPFFHSPTAEHRRTGMLFQPARLWPRRVVERLHHLIRSTSASPPIPGPAPRGGRGRAQVRPRSGQPQPRLSGAFSFQAGSPAGEERPRRYRWVSDSGQLAPEAGRAGPRPPGARREKTRTYPGLPAGGRG